MLAATAAFLVSALQNPTPVDVSLDLNQKRAEINPYIYGQFIEHLGRCIYGGIWAEMLEDRKFYHPVTKEYRPYGALQDTEFPVIARSPWEVVKGEVTMSTKEPFVGKHTPILASGTELRQNRLGAVAGKEYVGYIWLKAVSGTPKVSVQFDGATFTVPSVSDKFVKTAYKFKATRTGDDHRIVIRSEGGSVALGTLSLMPGDNVRGMRKDTLIQLKALGGTIYRWPGGNFVSGYDWRDGIGDRDRRPPRTNPAWGGLEHNDFGTDEFMDFCKEIGADPLVTVNTGFGDAYTAAQWVEYCNGDSKTIGGSWRIKNGNRKPYAVKTWCVGNEMWGDYQLGFMKLQHYVLKHNWVAEAMWKVDPKLVLISSGDLGNPNGEFGRSWSKGLLERSHKYMDMVSEHFYDGRLPWNRAQRYPIQTAAKQMAINIKGKADGHRAMQRPMKQLEGKLVPIAMDEWNYWHRDYTYGELGCEYDLADALGIAAGLHEFFRQSDIIQIATYAQTVNVIGAIKTNRTAAEMESTGLALQVYRQRYGSVPVKISHDRPDLDIEAAVTADGKNLTIGIVNPTAETVTLKVNLTEKQKAAAKSYYVTGEKETDKNTPGKPRKVDIYQSNGIVMPRLSCGVVVIPL